MAARKIIRKKREDYKAEAAVRDIDNAFVMLDNALYELKLLSRPALRTLKSLRRTTYNRLKRVVTEDVLTLNMDEDGPF